MATPNAKRCAPAFSPSGWVEGWAEMCDQSLAVLFKGGKCCWYPGAPAGYFDLALTWQDGGEFVRRFLYKKLAYRVIPLPCPPKGCGASLTCCPGVTVPTTLFLTGPTLTGSVTLSYDGSEFFAGVDSGGTGWRWSCAQKIQRDAGLGWVNQLCTAESLVCAPFLYQCTTAAGTYSVSQ